jgi:hypothetical protein
MIKGKKLYCLYSLKLDWFRDKYKIFYLYHIKPNIEEEKVESEDHHLNEKVNRKY